MKRLMGLMVAVAVLGAAMSVSAGERTNVKQTAFPGPALYAPSFALGQAPPAPAGAPAMQPVPAASAPAVELFHCVKVKDRKNIAPCAVPCIVMVPDPCPSTCCDPCGGCCAPPKCVAVQICVPPCGCPEIKRSKNGRKVKYDYGDYEVEIESRDGVVKVDYDD